MYLFYIVLIRSKTLYRLKQKYKYGLYDIRLLFKIKHSVLTPAHKSQKETNTSSSANPSVRNTSCCCFYDTYHCGHE